MIIEDLEHRLKRAEIDSMVHQADLKDFTQKLIESQRMVSRLQGEIMQKDETAKRRAREISKLSYEVRELEAEVEQLKKNIENPEA